MAAIVACGRALRPRSARIRPRCPIRVLDVEEAYSHDGLGVSRPHVRPGGRSSAIIPGSKPILDQVLDAGVAIR